MAGAEDAGSGPSKRTRPAPAMPGLTSWDPLPETLIREVASCLCMKECFQATQVSKPWHAAINSADMWMQHIEREWPDVHVVVSRLEADAPGQSELCKSLRELCLKLLQSSRGKEKRDGGRRSSADYERLRKEAEERRRKRFADVFVRIHVTNRHTEEVLYTKTACMSDPDIVNELFRGNGHLIMGGLEYDLEAYQDYKVVLSLIDLGGDGLRVAELRSVENLVMEERMTADAALLTARTWTSGSHRFGSKWEAASICIDCEFMAHLVKYADEEDEEEPEGVWELSGVVRFSQVHEYSGMDGFEPYHFKDIKAAYDFLEPFVDTPSLLKWN